MQHAAARAVGILCLLGALTSFTPNTQAGEVPATAVSISLGMPPLLVEHPALTAQFPQMLAGQPRQAFGWQLGSSSTADATGGIVRLDDSAGLLLLSQWHESLTAGRQRLLQAAAGVEFGVLRIGLAARGFDDRSSENRVEQFSGQDANVALEEEFSFVEGAVGAGLRLGEATVDVVAEYRDEDNSSSTFQSSPQSAQWFRQRAVTRSTFHFVGHGTFPIAADLRATLVAAVNTGDRSWQGSADFGTQTIATSTADDAATVQVGAAVEHEIAGAGTVTFYGNRDDQRAVVQSRYDIISQANTVIARAGLAWRGDVFPRTQLLLGVNASRVSTKQTVNQVRTDGLQIRARDTRSITDQLSWGLTHAWGALRLAGAMRSTLDLDSTFITLDAAIVF